MSREAVPYYSVRELTWHFVVDCQPFNEGRKLGNAAEPESKDGDLNVLYRPRILGY